MDTLVAPATQSFHVPEHWTDITLAGNFPGDHLGIQALAYGVLPQLHICARRSESRLLLRLWARVEHLHVACRGGSLARSARNDMLIGRLHQRRLRTVT